MSNPKTTLNMFVIYADTPVTTRKTTVVGFSTQGAYISLVVYSHDKKWYRQSPVKVYQGGLFYGTVCLGGVVPAGPDFTVVALRSDKPFGPVKLEDLDQYDTSNSVVVSRV